MTTDLTMLAACAVLLALQSFFGPLGRTYRAGLKWGFGNRDETPPGPPWIERAERAHKNLLENLPVFAVLVLVAHVAGKANDTTALASTIFVASRVAYLGVYIAGLCYVRTLVFVAGTVANLILASQLVL